MKLIQKASKFEVKDYDDKTRIVKGYASVFSNLDSDSDVIHKGAFTKTVKEWGPEGKDRIKVISQHNINRPVARITTLKEDTNGLYIEAKFGTHTDGEDHYRMAKEGIVNEFSVGFVATKKSENNKGGLDITEIKLYEVSMVTVAANDKAIITDVKSLDPLKLVEQIEGQEDLAHKLEHEILILMSNTRETSTKAESGVATKEDSLQPEVVEKDALTEELLKLF